MGTDQEAAESEKRFANYVEQLASVMGHRARERPMRDYCTGLVMPLERKSVEPLAALTQPGHARPTPIAFTLCGRSLVER
jgi:SRSO17 transposase